MTTSPDFAKDHTKSPLARLRRKLSPKKSTIVLSPSPSITMQQQQQPPLLQRVFDYFDKDGDGKISPSELQSCVRATGGQLSLDEAAAAVNSSDMDGDGLLGYYEFVILMEGGGDDIDKAEEKNKELREAFGMYEMGGSGCITPASLRTMLSRLGGSHSLEDCKAMIRTFDLNGDGVLSFDEFAVMMR